MKYYEVKAKCGHVGRNNYIIINFAVAAENGRDAAKIIRFTGRVKHHHKDAIQSVREITFDEYNELLKKNSKDPYLHAKNKKEQREECPALDFYIMKESEKDKAFDKKQRKERIKALFRKRKIMEDMIKREFNYI